MMLLDRILAFLLVVVILDRVRGPTSVVRPNYDDGRLNLVETPAFPLLTRQHREAVERCGPPEGLAVRPSAGVGVKFPLVY